MQVKVSYFVQHEISRKNFIGYCISGQLQINIMSGNKGIKITSEVRMDDRILYLVRVDKEEMAFVDTEREAQLVVDSIAAAESKRLENDWVQVFRQDLDGGRKVIISTQALGIILNGSITKVCTIDFIPVGRVVLTKGRLTLTDSMINVGNSIISPSPVLEASERLVKDQPQETSDETPESKPKEDDNSGDDTQEEEKSN